MDGQPAGDTPSANAPENPPAPSPLKPATQQTDVTHQSANVTTNQENPTAELRREFHLFEILSLGVQSILAIVGIGALCIYGFQLAVMRGTLTEMKRSGSESTQQVWRAIDNINWLARSMDLSQKVSQQAVESSQRQSKAALDASINNARLDQRPWVVLNRFELSAEPEENVPFTGTFWIINSGRTPAIHAAPRSTILLNVGEPAFTDFSRAVGARNAGMLTPGGVGDMHFVSSPLTLNRAQLDAYRNPNGAVLIYGHAIVDYEDAFTGSKPHWTRICISHAYGRPLTEFRFCNTGNDVDHQ